jgi:heparan sulfate N-deacetylase/N-sulfotransferase NDST2
MDRYLTMDKWNRELLDKYCRQYQVIFWNIKFT